MKHNPKKDMIIELITQGHDDKKISARCQTPVGSVRYYRRAYTLSANNRQKYTPDFVEMLIAAKAENKLAWFIATHDLPPTSVGRLILAHEAAKTLRVSLSLDGIFNPRNTKECYAVGLGRNQVAKSIFFLKKMCLSLQMWKGVFYLYCRRPEITTRFPMTFQDEVDLLTDPRKWLGQNTERLRTGWEVITKKARGAR